MGNTHKYICMELGVLLACCHRGSMDLEKLKYHRGLEDCRTQHTARKTDQNVTVQCGKNQGTGLQEQLSSSVYEKGFRGPSEDNFYPPHIFLGQVWGPAGCYFYESIKRRICHAVDTNIFQATVLTQPKQCIDTSHGEIIQFKSLKP